MCSVYWGVVGLDTGGWNVEELVETLGNGSKDLSSNQWPKCGCQEDDAEEEEKNNSNLGIPFIAQPPAHHSCLSTFKFEHIPRLGSQTGVYVKGRKSAIPYVSI